MLNCLTIDNLLVLLGTGLILTGVIGLIYLYNYEHPFSPDSPPPPPIEIERVEEPVHINPFNQAS